MDHLQLMFCVAFVLFVTLLHFAYDAGYKAGRRENKNAS